MTLTTFAQMKMLRECLLGLDVMCAIWLVFSMITLILLLTQLRFIIALWPSWRQNALRPSPDMSLVLLGKDAADHMKPWLDALQSHPLTEKMPVIVVDDQSQGHSKQALEQLIKAHPHMHAVHVPPSVRFQDSSKLAYTLGFKACTTRYAVCVNLQFHPPEQLNQWLSTLMQPLGGRVRASWVWSQSLGGYGSQLGHAMAHMQTARRQVTAGHATGLKASAFAIDVKSFFQVKGFLSHMHLDGGTIEFLMNDLAQLGQVKPVLAKNMALLPRFELPLDVRVRKHRKWKERNSPKIARILQGTHLLLWTLLIAKPLADNGFQGPIDRFLLIGGTLAILPWLNAYTLSMIWCASDHSWSMGLLSPLHWIKTLLRIRPS